MHELRESAQDIGQSKRYDHPLIKSVLRLECRLPFIARADPDLIIAALEIDFLKDSRTD